MDAQNQGETLLESQGFQSGEVPLLKYCETGNKLQTGLQGNPAHWVQ